MHGLSTTAGIVALAAAGVGVVALLTALGLIVSVRRLRAAQRIVLGERQTDLVEHAAGLQRAFESLAASVGRTAEELEGRMAAAEYRLDGAIAHRALVRYDAYGEMSGRQSMSIALLDAGRSGVVLSSIHHRDSARLYAKQVHHGKPELELSPEEAEAIRIALGGAGTGAGA